MSALFMCKAYVSEILLAGGKTQSECADKCPPAFEKTTWEQEKRALRGFKIVKTTWSAKKLITRGFWLQNS